jgi:RNA polymerase sigma factor (sigma-70 family)
MGSQTIRKSAAAHRPYLVAMVLGTALSASTPALGFTGSPAELRTASDISRYCTACWRNARLSSDCWADCTQEVFSRLLERLPTDSWDRALKCDGEERREFFRAIDAVKKRSQRARRWANSVNDQVADRRDMAERHLADEREVVRQVAAEVLSSRQQQILDLSFDGWSVNEIAAKLELPAARISDEKYKAIRKLREAIVEAA